MTVFLFLLTLQLRVIRQPDGAPEFVSRLDGTVTQFQQAQGLAFLAHNYASGRYFSDLKIGDEIKADDRVFHVTEIVQYQAIDPDNVKSEFIDLATGERLTAAQLFKEIYADPDRLVLQTCIERDGIDSWGRLFVIAEGT